MKVRGRPKVAAVVTQSGPAGEGTADTEHEVRTLEELYAACRNAPPSKLIRVVLHGDDGEVRLHFASFHRRRV
jgi:aminoglycoside phosphotransferase